MIPFRAPNREPPEVAARVDSAIQRVRQSQNYTRARELNSFESAFADFVGADQAVGVNSGADALSLAMQTLGVSSGDAVIVPSHTYIATANAVVDAGGTPVFADVDPETYCLDPDSVRANLSDDVVGIVPVHLYGRPAKMDALRRIADRNNLFIVEDVAQAPGARTSGKQVGTLGEMGCFSFFPSKNLPACGNGGMIVTDDTDLAADVRHRRQQGYDGGSHHTCIGVNSVLDEIQAAVLSERLPYLEQWNQNRRDAAARYTDLLADAPVRIPNEEKGINHVYHLYVIQSCERDELADHLESEGIEVGIHYPNAIHEDQAYRQRETDHNLPVTERLTSEILSLPMHPWLRSNEIKTISQTIHQFYE